MESKRKKAIVIPARFASTRLPGKPLIEIKGKPLIQWVYERANQSLLKDEIFIATDDERIREKAITFGACVIMTPVTCSSGTERVFEAVKDRDIDIIVNVQGDEPFIRKDMIDMLFFEMEKGNSEMVTLCSPIKDEKEYTDPNTVKVVLDKKGFALYFSRSPIPFLRNRPDFFPLNLIFKHIGIYGYTKDFLVRYVNMKGSFLEEVESLEQLRVLENGYRIKVLKVDYDGFGIDTVDDLKKADEYLNERL
ncbi:MAG: 3-deoxy-manno-octulosonate cytidylyltransferase [Syntrophorhabdaceae bacterium]|nr:3-deoxy-manno-octulosonate cytidylyltransferase [Syntrophorhabdaceae bacterium]